MKSFDTWNYEEVENTFHIQEMDTLPLLEEWLSAEYEIEEHTKINLHKMKDKLKKKAKAWNEDELKMFFIAPLLEDVELETPYFQPYTQRSISATIGEIEVGGRVDLVVAKGKRSPQQPFFCLHEYKQDRPPLSPQIGGIKGGGDALGQLLISMVVAQALNTQEIPILGTYIVGRNWFFVVLLDKKYAVSNEYNAADDSIFKIFAILQKAKEIMIRHS